MLGPGSESVVACDEADGPCADELIVLLVVVPARPLADMLVKPLDSGINDPVKAVSEGPAK